MLDILQINIIPCGLSQEKVLPRFNDPRKALDRRKVPRGPTLRDSKYIQQCEPALGNMYMSISLDKLFYPSQKPCQVPQSSTP